jgi:hypothetical protein
VTDLLFVAIAVAFFAVCVGYVRLCDRIIGPDPTGRESGDPAAATAATAPLDVTP